MDYSGKVVIVTGAGKGIGKCIAETYTAEGADVIIAETDTGTGQGTAGAILKSGGKAKFIRTDVSDPADILRLMAAVEENYHRLDILINNAGISRWDSPLELPVETWDKIINTNLRSVFLCTREAAKLMKKQGRGSVVNISSTRAFMSEPGTEAYAASKGGIVAITHAFAASLSEYKIQVNCISPGWIETGDYSGLTAADHKQHLSGRVGKPSDIAAACLYLTRDGNEFINGANIIIDGGMTRKMIYSE